MSGAWKPADPPLRAARLALAVGALSSILACDRRSEVGAGDSRGESVSPSIDFSTTLDGNTIEIRLDRDEALVGDPIRLIVVATPAADRTAEIESPSAALGAFDVVELPAPRDAALRPGAKAIALELSTFESGTLELPPIRARFEPRGGGVEIELSSAPVPIVVESVLEGEDLSGAQGTAAELDSGVDPENLRAAKGIVAMDDGRREAWWIVASVGVTVLAIVGGLLFLRRRGSPPEPAPGPWAIERFAALAEACRRGGPISPAWAEATTVLRGYLARGCGIPAADLTTREILEAIGDEPSFGDPVRATIAAFLRQADLVKFAGASADAEASARTIDAMRDLVASLEDDRRDSASGGDR